MVMLVQAREGLVGLGLPFCHPKNSEHVDVGWHISSTHAFSARGPGFDPTPKAWTAFYGSLHLPSFRQQT
jgi:hypothetical protein